MLQSVAISLRGFVAIGMLTLVSAHAGAQEFQDYQDYVQLASWQGNSQDGQAQIDEAQRSRRGINFVEVKGVTVAKTLPDDNKGLRHQKWIVTLNNGSQMMGVYNIDLGEHIPLKEGDVINMAGQYIWDRGGGLLHWLHADPKGRRPDGYVEVNGVRYGDIDRGGGGGQGRGKKGRRR
jgi:hypothetical protein